MESFGGLGKLTCILSDKRKTNLSTIKVKRPSAAFPLPLRMQRPWPWDKSWCPFGSLVFIGALQIRKLSLKVRDVLLPQYATTNKWHPNIQAIGKKQHRTYGFICWSSVANAPTRAVVVAKRPEYKAGNCRLGC